LSYRSNTCSLTLRVANSASRPKETRVRVLGVDPGLTRCGLGAVEGVCGQQLTAVAFDVIRTPAAAELGHRLMGIGTALEEWIDRYRPDAIAVERVFSQHNVRTVMGTAQVAGVAIVAATRRGIPVVLHTPSEVKAAVTGSGRADKAQVTTMVTRLLRLTERPSPPDAADALALAMCCIWRGSAVERLAESSSWGGSSNATRATPAVVTPARSAT
jgi:crossover junction endodeoxyribonuclease RuvC